MSYATGSTENGLAVPRNGAARRPSSITELADKVMVDLWDDTKDFNYYLKVAAEYRKDGKEYARKNDLEGAFIQLARAATLVFEKLPNHRDYNTMLNSDQRHNLALNGQDILDRLADLKVTLVDRYDKWLQKHPDGADLEQTPNIRTQKIASDDAAALAQKQRERFQEEEQAQNNARVQQQRIAAEESAKWKQLSDQKRAQDEAERARRKDATVAAARQAANSLPPRPYYTFSRPPNAYGSQSTVVLSEGQPPNDNVRQQQEQTRLREEDITRRQAEQKRKQEQEGIARRQKEADEAAPSSSFYQQAPIDYPQAQPLRNNYSDAPEKFERPATAMFNGTQTISGGTFVLNVISSDRRGFKLLEKRVATSAFHNSAQHIDPPRCHPNTRVAIQKQIYDWIMMDLLIRQSWIMWMHGAAGAGKSAIMRSIAELCEQAQIPLATFFFFRTDDTRNSISPLIATLVYQLIQNIPQAQHEIFRVIERNPLIFDQSLEFQLEKLVIQPLLRLQEHFKCYFVILIDGLDECIERAHQADLIKLLGSVSRSRTIPVIFLVASRRQPQIEAVFIRKEVSDLVLAIPLDNSDVEQTSDDIRRFLVDNFRDIRETHLLKHYLPSDWPAPPIVDEILAKSSGQFIFASTVINYLASPRPNPSTQLDIIRGIRMRDFSSRNPFAHLDALYQHILSQVEARDKVFDIIALHLLTNYDHISTFERVFLLEAGDLGVLFANLTALVLCESHAEDTPKLKFLHASLPDFLLDKSRSGQYHIDLDEYRIKILCALLERPPLTLDAFWGSNNLEDPTDQERSRLLAIGELLKKEKASERLRSAFMNFNCKFYTKSIPNSLNFFCADILELLKRLDFGDQGEAYCHVEGVFAAEYAKYWLQLDDYRRRVIQGTSPDLVVRIRQILEQAT